MSLPIITKEYSPEGDDWLCIEYLEPEHSEITRYLIHQNPDTRKVTLDVIFEEYI